MKSHTISNFVRDSRRFLAYVGKDDPGEISPDDSRRYCGWLQSERSAKTVHEAQLAVRRFYAFLIREGEAEHDPTRSAKLVAYRVDPQRTYTPDEVKGLLAACPASTSSSFHS